MKISKTCQGKKLIVVVGAIALLSTALYAETQKGHSESNAPKAKSCMCCDQNKMAMHQKMQANMAASEAKLGKLVATMNNAKASQKVNAMAAVINELVAQHKAIHSKMAGGMKKPMPSMAKGQCMMKGKMEGTPPTPKPENKPDAHAGHH